MNVGVAITTYASDKTSLDRYKIIENCFESIYHTIPKQIPIFIINDGSKQNRLMRILRNYSDRFFIINKSENKGISSAKNTCIKALYDKGIDLMFVLDDDVIIKKNFIPKYIEAIEKTKISHFNYIVRKLQASCEKHLENGFVIMKSPMLNGCFMTITKEMVDEIGYFKVLPNRYGHEHTEYSLRAIRNGFAPGFMDIQDSEDYIEFNELAYSVRSDEGLIDNDKILENSKAAFADETIKYVPFKD